VNLGYNPVQAQKAAQKILKAHGETEDLSVLIRESLKVVC